MPDLLIETPVMGLDCNVPKTVLDLKHAAKGSENIFYEYGLLRTPDGISKLDLTTGLNSGDRILAIFPWYEIDRYSHMMAVTTEKIYEHDRINEEWDDRTQSGVTMASDAARPISWAEVGHDDTNIYYDEDSNRDNAYHHLVVCDGGLSNIQRWAGRYETDFANVGGGGDYHSGTTHRALQVAMSKRNRMILLSPLEYNGTKWVENNQRLRWPTIGKLQTWTGTGSGFVDMMDTGGINVWSASLGMDHIIYQTRGIWSINYVGGTTVFYPVPRIPDLGLLSYHLLCNFNNVHYFMGTDYNIHAYYGGTSIEPIGRQIHKYLQEDMNRSYEYSCWIVMGPEGRFLWVFIVLSGETAITKAYVRNQITGAWQVRDFSSKFTSGGLTAVCMAASESYTVGETYQEALDTTSVYDNSVAGDATERFGELLMDTSRTLSADYTAGTWSAGGFDYSKNGENFNSDFTTNDLMVVFDPSATNTRVGTHFYTVYDVSTNGFSVYGAQDVSTQGDHGIADNSTNVPADLSVAGADTIGFYSVCADDDPGETYRDPIQEIKQADRMILGDSAGYVYQMDETYTNDDGNSIACRHLTPVITAGSPHTIKRWGHISVSADGTADGAMKLSYRTGNFDTSDTGWVDFTMDLSTENKTFDFFPNVSSNRIQYNLHDYQGKSFKVTDFVIGPPVQEFNR